MQIFLDSADTREIEKWLNSGLIDGVTTNPSIMYRDGLLDLREGTQQLASLITPLPLSIEVVSNDPEEMYLQGRELASWGDNIVVKIPQVNMDGVPCYGVMHRLEEEGIRINATVALSLSQVILSAKAGASYISLFAGRIADEGGNAGEVVADAVDWVERWQYKSRLIVGSIRSVGDVLQAALAGAHIVTIPPQFVAKMADHQYSRETVKQFLDDANKAAKARQTG
ncbi:MAG: transaldolase [Dehalococcoidia bacterium]|nr:transaldolase [Dehalococcoidia bacterium]